MTSEKNPIDSSLDTLLNQHFAGKVVRKDLTKLLKEGANVPVYVLEYLLGTYCASNDEPIIQDGLKTVKRILAENYVRPDEAEKVKSTVRERGSLKVIDKVTVVTTVAMIILPLLKKSIILVLVIINLCTKM